MATLDIEHLAKRFGAVTVIPDLSLSVAEGEFLVLVGPSGCGKSTLLRLIAGLEQPSGGAIRIDGRDVTDEGPKERGIGMVFQSYALYPHMNAKRNIGFGLEMARMAKASIDERIANVSAKLQLNDYLRHKPRELSGGQRQRVAIGRAMTREPKLFLLDEPLSNLDASLRSSMRVEISRLRRQVASTMIYVTHDQVEAMTLADRIVVLDGGKIAQAGAPMDLYDQPANRFVASFIGSPAMNFLTGCIASLQDEQADVALDAGFSTRLKLVAPAAQGQRVTLGIRPEHIAIVESADAAQLSGVAEVVELLGSDTFIHVDSAGGMIAIRAGGGNRPHRGDAIHICAPPARSYLFDSDGARLA
jgi:multiple sugar transport system ATP-binding protein